MPRLRNRPGNGVSLGRYRTAPDADPEHLEPSQPRRSKPRRTPWAGTGRCRPTDTSASPHRSRLGSYNPIFNPCNPLKSHKTAKTFFGNPWRETREIWKGLDESLQAALIPPPLLSPGGPAARVCSDHATLRRGREAPTRTTAS